MHTGLCHNTACTCSGTEAWCGRTLNRPERGVGLDGSTLTDTHLIHGTVNTLRTAGFFKCLCCVSTPCHNSDVAPLCRRVGGGTRARKTSGHMELFSLNSHLRGTCFPQRPLHIWEATPWQDGTVPITLYYRASPPCVDVPRLTTYRARATCGRHR